MQLVDEQIATDFRPKARSPVTRAGPDLQLFLLYFQPSTKHGRLEYAEVHSYRDLLKNDNLSLENSSAVLHRDTRHIPRKAVGGKGSYIFLEDGSKFLDSTGGPAVSCLGHGDEEIHRLIKEQVDRISFVHSGFFGTQVSEDLARFVTDSTGGKLSKLFVVSSGMWFASFASPLHFLSLSLSLCPLDDADFCRCSGSEAVEAALKLSRQYFLELPVPQPQRTRFIARLPSYHGTTLGALAVGGHILRREPFEPILAQNVSHVSPCYAYRGMKEGESSSSYVARLAAELDSEFQRLGPESVCAFIAEPVVGAVRLSVSKGSL